VRCAGQDLRQLPSGHLGGARGHPAAHTVTFAGPGTIRRTDDPSRWHFPGWRCSDGPPRPMTPADGARTSAGAGSKGSKAGHPPLDRRCAPTPGLSPREGGIQRGGCAVRPAHRQLDPVADAANRGRSSTILPGPAMPSRASRAMMWHAQTDTRSGGLYRPSVIGGPRSPRSRPGGHPSGEDQVVVAERRRVGQVVTRGGTGHAPG